MSSFGRRTAPATVLVNVYDLALPANEFLFPVGLGLYHSGVEIGGSEYTYADAAGVFAHAPRAVPDHAPFRQQIDMGQCDASLVPGAIAALSASDSKFGPHEYNVLQNNCNHFTRALVWHLLKKPIPGYINRLADMGACCSCLIPKQLLQNAPVNNEAENKSETSAFLVRAPANRTMATTNNSTTAGGSSTTTAFFQGHGAKLGGGSASLSSSLAADALTDRREKARMAALARLERQQQQQGNDSDKSH